MSILTEASLIVTPNAYKAGTLLSVVPSSGAGDMDVARNSGATKTNSAGLIEDVAVNVPRLDYSNGTCPSILVEPQRTNLLLRSEEFENAYWAKQSFATVTADSAISPSGYLTADLMHLDAGSEISRVERSGLLVSANNSITLSFFIKNISLTSSQTFKIRLVSADYDLIGVVNLANKSISVSISGVTVTGYVADSQSGGVVNYANGWDRYYIKFTKGTTAQNSSVFIINNDFNNKDFYAWGAQLEQGSYPTSYIPTTSASVTRVADVVSKTGISDLIGQTEGTMFVDVDITTDTSGFYNLGNTLGATSNHYITINTFQSTGNIYTEIVNGTQQALIISTVNSGRCKIALAYKNNDVAFYINGNLIGTDTSATIPPTSAFGTEYETTIGNRNIKNYNTIALWKTRLTNDQLAQLTTL